MVIALEPSDNTHNQMRWLSRVRSMLADRSSLNAAALFTGFSIA